MNKDIVKRQNIKLNNVLKYCFRNIKDNNKFLILKLVNSNEVELLIILMFYQLIVRLKKH